MLKIGGEWEMIETIGRTILRVLGCSARDDGDDDLRKLYFYISK